MQIMRIKPLFLISWVWVLFQLPAASAWADSAAEIDRNNLISAYIYNFARFTQWQVDSDGATEKDFVTFCSLGEGPLSTQLEQTVQGELISGKPTRFLTVTAQQLGQCDILLVENAHMSVWESVKQLASAQGSILTIGEQAGFVNTGGMVGFVQRGSKIKPVVNIAQLNKSKLKISSKLLRLSTLVGQ